ncbi:MAG TPA: peptide deformylase [Candidatus Aminicenantes bacterium]|nr:peptide deformylase [Candidatus Aminicenantes bacterium]
MAILEILRIGHPILAKKAVPVGKIDDDLCRLARDMAETMHAAPGVGLAAPQVGFSKRLITVDLSLGERKEDLIILANPEILSREGQIVCEEGCLSVPGIYEKVARPARVVAKGLDLEGREKTIEADDMLARALCHEIDHLEGKLFVDRLSPLKRAMIKKRLRREASQGKRE